MLYTDLVYDPFIKQDKYDIPCVDELYLQKLYDCKPNCNYIYIDELKYSDNDTFSLFHMNIRSIPKNMNAFKEFVLSDSSVKFDVIGLTEVRLDSSLSSMYHLPGYSIYSNARNVHGGGVALYVSDTYGVLLQNNLSFSLPSIETLAIEVNISSNRYLLICIYRPPNGKVNDFICTMTYSLLCMTKNMVVYMFLVILT